MDIPDARGHASATRRGHLQRLHSRTFPYLPQYWRRKFFVLAGDTLYCYDKEDARGSDRGNTSVCLKTGVTISDVSEKEHKKISHVFSITTNDSTVSEGQKLVLAAESAADKQNWLRDLNRVNELHRNNDRNESRRHSVHSGEEETSNIKQTSPKSLTDSFKRRSLQNDGKDPVQLDAKHCNEKPSANQPTKDQSGVVPMIDEDSADSAQKTMKQINEAGNMKMRSEMEIVLRPVDKDDENLPSEKESHVEPGQENMNLDESSTGDTISNNNSTEGRKRKADDDPVDASYNNKPGVKTRDRGPSGRRSGQQRRSALLKQKAASTSSLAGRAAPRDPAAQGFEPWLNRSLDLDSEEHSVQSVQPHHVQYLWSDPEDCDLAEKAYEYNIELYNDGQETYDDVSRAEELYVQPMEAGYVPEMAILPVSGADYPQMQMSSMPQAYDACMQPQIMTSSNEFRLVADPSMQHQMQCIPPLSSFPQQPEPLARQKKNNQRRSRHLEDTEVSKMQNSFNNELFIASFNDENNTTNPHPNEPLDSKKKLRPRRPSKTNAGALQQELNRFNDTAMTCRKHVVQLDQAVSGISKEVEGFKGELKALNPGLSALKAEKEKLKESVSGLFNDVAKMKDQLHSMVKEVEKLQVSVNKTLNDTEKSKIEQQNLKNEYERMLKELKATITGIKSQGDLNIYSNVENIKDYMSSGLVTDEASADTKANSNKSESTKKHFFSRPSSLILGITSKNKTNSLTRKGTKDKNGKTKNDKSAQKNLNKVSQTDMPLYAVYDGSKFNLEKSMSSPSVNAWNDHNSMKNLNREDVPTPTSAEIKSFDTVSTKSQFYGRPVSPPSVKSLRPGSSPVSLTHQNSMTTVPEDRAVIAGSDSAKSINYPGIKFQTISRQSSTPNIVAQINGRSGELPRQSSLEGHKERLSKNNREPSIISTDDRPIVDRTLTMSPASSMISFPGSMISAASLNHGIVGGMQLTQNYGSLGSGVLAGSSSKPRKVYPLDAIHEVGPLATSSLKRRKKIKKDQN